MFKKKNLAANYIYWLGLIFLIIASIFSTGYHHFDEHFQILEFAGTKLGLTTPSNLPWEYHYQMRPSIQPTLVVIVYHFFGLISVKNPFFIVFFLRLLSAGLTFFSITLLYKVFKDRISSDILRRWFLILTFTLWVIIYSGVRFSSENWSGLLFVIGFSCYFLFKRKNFFSFLTIGIVLGLSFLFRYQTAFLTLGFSSWLLFIKKEQLKKIFYVFFGFIFISFVGILIDKWFYGEWTLTAWNYFTQNILEDKVSGFGVEPWWWYITESIRNGAPPISLLFVIGFFVVTIYKPKSPIIWSITPFILIHSVIGHKELRFLFPIILFLPIIIIQGIEVLQNKYLQNLSSNKYMKGFMKLVFILNFGLLVVVMFKPADNNISLYNKLYESYENPTVLYYIEHNPYHRVLDINFYKRNNFLIRPIVSIGQIPEGENKLVALEQKDKSNNPRLGNLIYSTYPNWLLKFNFNNWQDRTHSWYIYEVK